MKTYEKLIEDLEHNLQALENEADNILSLSKQSIVLCKQVLQKLRIEVVSKNFNSDYYEIQFYKYIKPRVLSNLIFYVKRLHVEGKRPKEGKKEQVKFLKKHITFLQKYFNNNLEFYHYYKSKASHFDTQYFLKKNKTVRLNIEAYHFFIDEEFSTSHDTTVATIMAYTKLIEYLRLEINKLEDNNMQAIISPFQKESNLKWTGNKTDLTELIYALHSSGVINSGASEIKDIAIVFEQIFNIDLGNYYHSFVEMRNRKINPTKFIDLLKVSLTKYMKDLDDLNSK